MRFFADAGAEATGQDNFFHELEEANKDLK
jgi:hypothetical protein